LFSVTSATKSADTVWADTAVRVGDTMSVYVNNNVPLQQMAEKHSAPPTFGQPSHFVQPSPNFGQQHGWPQHGILDRGQPMGLVMPPYTPILSTNQVLPTFASPRPTGTEDEIAELKRELAELKADMKRLKPKEQQPWAVVYDNRHAELTQNAMDPTGGAITVGSQLVHKIKLPNSVYTSVWLLPLIDGRFWWGEPEKPYSQLPPQLQDKHMTVELNAGNTTNWSEHL
jgi:hypothetical protein